MNERIRKKKTQKTPAFGRSTSADCISGIARTKLKLNERNEKLIGNKIKLTETEMIWWLNGEKESRNSRQLHHRICS